MGLIFNGYVHVKCYVAGDVLPSCPRNMSQTDFSSLPYLYVPTEEHGNILDEIK